jgi:KUP system potassium uptake protein
MLTVVTLEVPFAPAGDRIEIEHAGADMYRVAFRYGFSEDPDVHTRLSSLTLDGEKVHPMEISYFLGRERIISTRKRGMAQWRERLFSVMSRNATGATAYFRIPPNQVVELGMQLEI